MEAIFLSRELPSRFLTKTRRLARSSGLMGVPKPMPAKLREGDSREEARLTVSLWCECIMPRLPPPPPRYEACVLEATDVADDAGTIFEAP